MIFKFFQATLDVTLFLGESLTAKRLLDKQVFKSTHPAVIFLALIKVREVVRTGSQTHILPARQPCSLVAWLDACWTSE